MITISERGKRIMDLDLQWNKYCRENNIEDPFEISRKLFSKRCRREGTDLIVEVEFDENGRIKDDPEEPTRQSKSEYIKMRDTFLAKKCFEEIDYDAFLFKAEKLRELVESPDYVPCKAADAQCRFECPMYWHCMNGEWKP